VLVVVFLVYAMQHKKIHGCEKMIEHLREQITKKFLSKTWTFNEISNLISTIETLSNEVYSELNLVSRFEMVRETKINDTMVGSYYPDVLRDMCLTHIKAEVAGTIRNMLGEATVNFGGNSNEVSEGSVGGKSHKKRTTDEKKNSEE